MPICTIERWYDPLCIVDGTVMTMSFSVRPSKGDRKPGCYLGCGSFGVRGPVWVIWPAIMLMDRQRKQIVLTKCDHLCYRLPLEECIFQLAARGGTPETWMGLLTSPWQKKVLRLQQLKRASRRGHARRM